MTKQKVNSKVLTNKGYVSLKNLHRQTKIAYLDTNNKLKITKKYIIETVLGESISITTKTGKEILLACDQEVIVSRDEVIEKVKVRDLKKGDKIALL